MTARTTPFGAAVVRLLGVLQQGVDADVVVGRPRSAEEPGVDVLLVRAVPGPVARYVDHHLQPVDLDFLIAMATVDAGGADLLHDAWVAVNAVGDLEILAEGVPADWWAAFGATPRPAFMVRARACLDHALEREPLAETLLVRHDPNFPPTVPPRDQKDGS